MARLAHVVIPALPHRVIQRGNALARTVFGDDDWRWSNVDVQLGLVANDGLTEAGPLLERIPDLADRIAAGEDLAMSERLRKAEMIGQPVGSAAFVADLETRSGRRLLPVKTGPKPKVGE